jgi:hypothetical protein
MQLTIDYMKKPLEKRVRYCVDSQLIIAYPTTYDVENGFSINYLSVRFNDKNYANSIGGSLEPNKIIVAPIIPPHASEGALIGKFTDEEHDGRTTIHYEMPVYCNPTTHWICMGHPESVGDSVEFLTDCIIVIGKDGLPLSLWIRPDVIPELPLLSLIHTHKVNTGSSRNSKEPLNRIQRIVWRWRTNEFRLVQD